MIVQDVLRQLAEDMKQFAKTETIFGEPIEIQGNTVIPVCKMSIDYGGGGGEGEGTDEKKRGGKGTGAGAGAGVKIEPAALIIAKEGEISVVGIRAKGSKLETLLEMLPETIEKLKAKKTKAKEAGEESESFSK
ncbi:sporulation protein [Candidatus Bipolaricaulota bacterium]|nr:sporulation protein [Candidatus Bipolaricaulota bacterium]